MHCGQQGADLPTGSEEICLATRRPGLCINLRPKPTYLIFLEIGITYEVYIRVCHLPPMMEIYIFNLSMLPEGSIEWEG